MDAVAGGRRRGRPPDGDSCSRRAGLQQCKSFVEMCIVSCLSAAPACVCGRVSSTWDCPFLSFAIHTHGHARSGGGSAFEVKEGVHWGLAVVVQGLAQYHLQDLGHLHYRRAGAHQRVSYSMIRACTLKPHTHTFRVPHTFTSPLLYTYDLSPYLLAEQLLAN
jgi:hypothetical protein